MNSIIELHDSSIVRITLSGDSVVIRFGPAYVHRSEGRPGIDPGSCWVQDIDFIMSECVLDSSFTDLPQTLEDGSFWIGTESFENVIPFPLDVRGLVRFSALGMNEQNLAIRANGAVVVPVGEARYVEQFPGNV